MKILAKEWRSGEKSVGIIAVEVDGGKKWIAYIGVAEGLSEKQDAERIVNWGAKLSAVEAIAFFPYLKAEDYKLK